MIVEMASFHPRLKGHGVLTYEDLMMMPFGIMGHHFILGSMLITSYGAMIAYLLIVKDTLVSIVENVVQCDPLRLGSKKFSHGRQFFWIYTAGRPRP